jgi:hypothetical protein
MGIQPEDVVACFDPVSVGLWDTHDHVFPGGRAHDHGTGCNFSKNLAFCPVRVQN